MVDGRQAAISACDRVALPAAPQLPAGKATFQNRQVASGRQEKPDGLQLRLKNQVLSGRKGRFRRACSALGLEETVVPSTLP
jgi:hypothetical protein